MQLNHYKRSPYEAPVSIKRQQTIVPLSTGPHYLRDHQVPTFDIEITPSKLIALFLAVNRSSLHPEISSCIYRKNYEKITSVMVNGPLRKLLIAIQIQTEDSFVCTLLHLHPTLKYPTCKHSQKKVGISH